MLKYAKSNTFSKLRKAPEIPEATEEYQISEVNFHKLQLENAKKDTEISKLREEIQQFKKIGFDTSTTFPWPDEFKSRWETFVRTMIMDNFDTISTNSILLMRTINILVKNVLEISKIQIKEKTIELLKCLGMQNISDTCITNFYNKFQKLLFQDFFKTLFTVSNELFDKIISQIKNEIILNKNILFNEKEIEDIFKDFSSENITKFIIELYFLCLYMHINEPKLTINTSTEIKYKFFSKGKFDIIEGFASDDDICLIILNPPISHGNLAFKGIKPAVFIIENPSKEVINICKEQQKKENKKVEVRQSFHSEIDPNSSVFCNVEVLSENNNINEQNNNNIRTINNNTSYSNIHNSNLHKNNTISKKESMTENKNKTTNGNKNTKSIFRKEKQKLVCKKNEKNIKLLEENETKNINNNTYLLNYQDYNATYSNGLISSAILNGSNSVNQSNDKIISIISNINKNRVKNNTNQKILKNFNKIDILKLKNSANYLSKKQLKTTLENRQKIGSCKKNHNSKKKEKIRNTNHNSLQIKLKSSNRTKSKNSNETIITIGSMSNNNENYNKNKLIKGKIKKHSNHIDDDEENANNLTCDLINQNLNKSNLIKLNTINNSDLSHFSHSNTINNHKIISSPTENSYLNNNNNTSNTMLNFLAMKRKIGILFQNKNTLEANNNNDLRDKSRIKLRFKNNYNNEMTYHKENDETNNLFNFSNFRGTYKNNKDNIRFYDVRKTTQDILNTELKQKNNELFKLNKDLKYSSINSVRNNLNERIILTNNINHSNINSNVILNTDLGRPNKYRKVSNSINLISNKQKHLTNNININNISNTSNNNNINISININNNNQNNNLSLKYVNKAMMKNLDDINKFEKTIPRQKKTTQNILNHDNNIFELNNVINKKKANKSTIKNFNQVNSHIKQLIEYKSLGNYRTINNNNLNTDINLDNANMSLNSKEFFSRFTNMNEIKNNTINNENYFPNMNLTKNCNNAYKNNDFILDKNIYHNNFQKISQSENLSSLYCENSNHSNSVPRMPFKNSEDVSKNIKNIQINNIFASSTINNELEKNTSKKQISRYGNYSRAKPRKKISALYPNTKNNYNKQYYNDYKLKTPNTDGNFENESLEIFDKIQNMRYEEAFMKHNKLYSSDAVKKFEFGKVRKNSIKRERHERKYTQNTQHKRESLDKYLRDNKNNLFNK